MQKQKQTKSNLGKTPGRYKEGEQGKGSTLADGPAISPTATRQGRHRQPRLRAGRPLGVDLNSADDAEVPRTPIPGRRPDSPPGTNLRTSEEDRLASSGWKLLEDLGAKKMEAPRGDTVVKGVSPCPPALQKVGDRT